MLTFAIVAGTMGPRQFGAFATVAALALITGSFSGWGADQLLLRRVGRAREELPRAMATSLVFLALSAPPLVLLSMALVPLAIDNSISWQIVLFVGVSDIALARVNTIAATCYHGRGSAPRQCLAEYRTQLRSFARCPPLDCRRTIP